MKNEPFVSPADSLSQMLTYNLTQMIYTIVKLGIPDLLASGPKRTDELAANVQAHSQSLYRLLRALASQGIFIEDQSGRFGNTPLSNLLRSDVPGTFQPFALSYGEPWWWNSWGSLLYSIQTGESAFNHVHGISLFEYLEQNPEAAKIFNANMTSMTAREAQAVVSAYDFSASEMVVDVGGGQGTLTTAILQTYPNAHAILFELPSVIEETRKLFEMAGIGKRCEMVGGNFFEEIPEGGDRYILKDVLHNWEDEQAIAILRNCRRSMRDSARLLLVERLITTGNDPNPGKLIDISMLVFTGGRERTAAEYRALLEPAGFHLNQIFPTEVEASIIEAVAV